MSAKPLSGLLVVDLSRHLPGPLAARLLADLGSRIVKIEEPELGDPVRLAPPLRAARSALAAQLLAGVESVALDLKLTPARKVLDRLLERSDVLLESFRPGVLARLGFPAEELRRRFPRLVVCSVSGWGQSGPLAARAGHDLTYQARAGSLAASGGMPAVPVADLLGAWSAVTAILAALLARQHSGCGAHLDAALFDAAVHGSFTSLAEETSAERAVGEPLSLSGALPCYNLYRARDGGLVAVAALERKFWRRFCDLIGRRDLTARQYDTSGSTRRQVAEIVARHDRDQWRELFDRLDLPAEPVLSVAEALSHPQARQRAMVDRGPDELFRIGFPVLFDGERPGPLEPVPDLGEHTGRVLEELGLDSQLGSERQRRRNGIGARRSLRRLLWRWSSR